MTLDLFSCDSFQRFCGSCRNLVPTLCHFVSSSPGIDGRFLDGIHSIIFLKICMVSVIHPDGIDEIVQ